MIGGRVVRGCGGMALLLFYGSEKYVKFCGVLGTRRESDQSAVEIKHF